MGINHDKLVPDWRKKVSRKKTVDEEKSCTLSDKDDDKQGEQRDTQVGGHASCNTDAEEN